MAEARTFDISVDLGARRVVLAFRDLDGTGTDVGLTVRQARDIAAGLTKAIEVLLVSSDTENPGDAR